MNISIVDIGTEWNLKQWRQQKIRKWLTVDIGTEWNLKFAMIQQFIQFANVDIGT